MTRQARLSSIRLSNAETISRMPGTPVAVFVGGTSGIGQGMAEAFARWRGGRAHIVIVGRNEDAAADILAHLPKPSRDGEQASTNWTHEFIPCDVSLMSKVHAASQLIASKYSKVNFLILSAGFLSTTGRDETSEGLDKKLALHYYSRWKLICELEPALRKAKGEGEEARVLSILVAGKGARLDLEDLGLEKRYSAARVRGQAITYNDYMIESFYARNPEITFTHAHPGGVDTPLMDVSPSPWMRAMAYVVLPIFRPLLTSKEDCAEYMWHGLLENAGAMPRRIRWDGTVIDDASWSGDEEAGRILWEHTEKATTVEG